MPRITKQNAKGIIDFKTGLSMQQVQAAKLRARGVSIVRTAAAVGCSATTIKNWEKKKEFLHAKNTIKPQTPEKLKIDRLERITPEELDKRLAVLVVPSIQAMNLVLSNPQSPEMAKVQAAKFVMNTLYHRLTQNNEYSTKEMDELRTSIKVIVGD